MGVSVYLIIREPSPSGIEAPSRPHLSLPPSTPHRCFQSLGPQPRPLAGAVPSDVHPAFIHA
eukprot:2024406-Pyramimonas_sp.AAC.1